jgi:hypothetical protein
MPTPDPGIKKVTILKKDLPEFNGETSSYKIRYRIVSEDRNRFSHWSPTHSVAVTQVDDIPYYVANTDSNIMTTVWSPTEDLKSQFDIYIRWDTDPVGYWKYYGSVLTNTYTVIKKQGAATFQIAVQVPTFPKKRYPIATLFESTPLAF